MIIRGFGFGQLIITKGFGILHILKKILRLASHIFRSLRLESRMRREELQLLSTINKTIPLDSLLPYCKTHLRSEIELVSPLNRGINLESNINTTISISSLIELLGED